MRKVDDYSSIMHVANQVTDALNNRCLLPFFELMEQNYPNLGYEYEEIKSTYKYMLLYFKEQKEDPERDSQFRSLVRKAYMLSDSLVDAVRLNQWFPDQGPTEAEQGRCEYMYRLAHQLREFAEREPFLKHDFEQHLFSKETLDLILHHDSVLDEFFMSVVRNGVWNSSFKSVMTNCQKPGALTDEDLATLLSAVMLSGLHLFTSDKLLFLLDAYDHPNVLVSQRALTCALLLMQGRNERLEVEPEVQARMKVLNRQQAFRENVKCAMFRLTQLLMNGKLENYLGERFNQTWNSISSQGLSLEEMQKKLHNGSRDPKWVEELQGLQEQGFDVNMASFRHLKNIPFFKNSFLNWFRPFTFFQGWVYGSIEKFAPEFRDSVVVLLSRQGFCDSDKYSFVQLANSIHRTGIPSPFPKPSQVGDSEEFSLEQQVDNILRSFAQDLYRFVNVYNPCEEMLFPLTKESFRFYQCDLLPWLKKDGKMYLDYARDYVAYDEYGEAALYLEAKMALPETEFEDPEQLVEYYKLLGDCYEQMGKFQEAIKTFKAALKLQPDNLDVMAHIVGTSVNEQNWKRAVIYLQKVLKLNPGNEDALSGLVASYIRMKQYDKALAMAFQLDYYSNDVVEVNQAMMRCYFMLGKWEDSRKAWEILREHKKLLTVEDYVFAGHLAWCSGSSKEAFHYYMKAFKKVGDQKAFPTAFGAMCESLLQHGISEVQIQLMKDSIVEALKEE